MTKMNHNRPQFVQQRMRDRWGWPAGETPSGCSPRAKGRLDMFLRTYQGDNEFLLECKALKSRGVTLTPQQAGKAGHLMNTLGAEGGRSRSDSRTTN
jgi:hypothetical protein